MLLQRAGTGTIPPPDFTPPNWASLTEIWDAAPKQVTPTVILGPAIVSLGHDDIEADDIDPVKALEVDGHEFGWDNESPKREVYVNKFSIEWRPITNGQFYDFYKSGGQEKVKFPASWVEHKGETCVSFKSNFLKNAVHLLTNHVIGSHYVRSCTHENSVELAYHDIIR
jgi:formylglycine-generating enzyme required for sulfatase activity